MEGRRSAFSLPADFPCWDWSSRTIENQVRGQVDADSALLALWVLGTFLFAAFVNWTVNARSMLPLIPAAAILLARRLDLDKSDLDKDEKQIATNRRSSAISTAKLAVPLALSAMISLAIACGDTAFANSVRSAASWIHWRTQNQPGQVLFEGHWGFQYYMQLLGARPVEYDKFNFQTGDIVVIPENTTHAFPSRRNLWRSNKLRRSIPTPTPPPWPWERILFLGLGTVAFQFWPGSFSSLILLCTCNNRTKVCASRIV